MENFWEIIKTWHGSFQFLFFFIFGILILNLVEYLAYSTMVMFRGYPPEEKEEITDK